MKKYIEYITESKSKEHPILNSAKRGGNTAVKKYIKSGVDVNIQDKEGRTPLMLAVYENFLMVVKTLIDAGADINIKDNDGRSALCRVNTLKILDMLLDAGADVNSKDKDGMTPMMEIIYNRRGYSEVIIPILKKHIEHGLNLDIKSNNDLNVYDQIRKWIVEDSLVQKYMDENYPHYKDEYDMKNNAEKYNL